MNYNPNAGFGAQDRDADERRVVAEFYSKAMLDEARSREAGRPIYNDVAFCRIVHVGENRLQQYDQPARDIDRQRFPRQWAAYKNDQKDTVSGTPLSVLFPQSPSTVENMRQVGLYTVEQLSELSDTAHQQIGMGSREFQERAKAYLAKAEGGKDFHALAAKLEQLSHQLAAKDARIAALEASGSEEEIPEKRGPGRPRKVETAAGAAA